MSSRRAPNGKCAACQHVERARAELLLAGGASLRSVAAKFRLDYHCLRRHWLRHCDPERKARLALGPVQQAALAARLSEENTSVIDAFKAVRAGLWSLYQSAVDASDRTGGALLAGRLHENLNSIARITGELSQSPLVAVQNNFFVSPEFAHVQGVLLRVLIKHPAARDDVIRAFHELEARAERPLLENAKAAA